jgi:ligand-binding sensor domain-containing protein
MRLAFQWGRHQRSLLLCALAVVARAPAFGIDHDRRLNRLYHTSWTLKDGTPGDIQALAQTSDGFLWLGTGKGLFQFDGVSFKRFESQSAQALPRLGIRSRWQSRITDCGSAFGLGAPALSRTDKSKLIPRGRG